MQIANIGSDGIELRLRGATIVFGATLLVAVAMKMVGAPTWAYFPLAIGFWLSSFLGTQGLFKT